MIRIRVPGKIHLVGEHSVVYGEPAILAALDRHITIKAEQSSEVIINGRMFDLEETKRFAESISRLWKDCTEKQNFSELAAAMKPGNSFVRAATGIMLNRFNSKEGVDISIQSDIPRGSGMGSSAAVSVAIAATFFTLFDKDADRKTINETAFGFERLLHGTPSGGDNSACCFGGFLWFRKNGESIEIENLDVKDSGIFDNFIIANTGTPKLSTCELVQNVRNIESSVRNPIIKDLGEATRLMKDFLEAGNPEEIKNIMNRTWDNLSGLGLSTPGADSIISNIRKVGGAAKLCGACGGGTLLAYHEDVYVIRKLISEAGYQTARIKLGVEGVTAEKVSP